jgi:DedD protein
MVDLMEKRKLLLVAVSVGVFLVIVIGASILIFSPRGASPAAVTNTVQPIPVGNPANTGTSGLPGGSDTVNLVKNSIDIQSLKTPADSNPQDNVFYIYGETPNEVITVDRTTTGTSNRLIVDVPRPATVAVPDAPERVTAKPVSTPARQAPAAAPKPTAPKNTAPKAAAPKAAAPKPAAKPAAPKTPENFWVQTGSFSTIAYAEAAKNTLASKGIISLIEDRNVGEKTFFRVRVGPYTSQKEADYWKDLIKNFNGFEGSLVLKGSAN